MVGNLVVGHFVAKPYMISFITNVKCYNPKIVCSQSTLDCGEDHKFAALFEGGTMIECAG